MTMQTTGEQADVIYGTEHPPSVAFPPTATDFSTWLATFGSGVLTNTIQATTAKVPKTIRLDLAHLYALLIIISQTLKVPAFCAVVHGTTTSSSTCAARTAAASYPRARTTLSVFVVVPAED